MTTEQWDVVPSSVEERAAVRRVILLGASNLTRAISTVVETAWLGLGGPLEILAALGHGRSYGMNSSVLGRVLPGIVPCGLWPALALLPQAPTFALVTDIGNDLGYGVSAGQIMHWVETCLDRLDEVHANVLMTGLPVARLCQLSPAEFYFLRTCFFPFSHFSRREALARAVELNERLLRVAEVRKISIFEPPIGWYGYDPLHIKMRRWSSAWHDVLIGWNHEQAPCELARGSLRRWIYLRSLAPLQRRILGWERHCPQPAGRFVDGTTIAYY